MMTIHEILGIAPQHRTFEFEGRSFEYHPESAGQQTAETLYTRWADGSRCASPLNLRSESALRQQLAILLSHKFRKGVSATEREDILSSARAALA